MIRHAWPLFVVCGVASTSWAQAAKPDAGVPAAKATAAPKAIVTEDLGLDLSATSEVKAVLVAPPIIRVVQTPAFQGVSAKVLERFDLAAHKRFVAAFQKELEGRVLPAESAAGAISNQGLGPTALRTPAGIQKLIRVTNVAWVVVLDVNKTGTLVGTIYDETGVAQGQPSYVTNPTGLTQKHADDMASFVAKELAVLAKAKADAAAKAVAVEATPVAQSEPTPPPEDDIVDPDLIARGKKKWQPSAERTRAAAAVGPGAALRSFELSGQNAVLLAELKTNPVVGLGVFINLQPLQWFDKTAGSRWADLEVDVHYRRAFSVARGQGSIDGQTCSMTDDDVMVRGTYRVRVADGTYAPWVGVGGGFSQEQTVFAATCALPLLGASYRGADAQLRYKQPLYKDLVALDVAVGPRVLIGQAGAQPGFSFAGEAWVEAKPYSVLFARAGARVSRLVVAGDNLGIVDTRVFLAAEVGAFF